MREFLSRSRSETTPATAAVFLGLLRRRVFDTAGSWEAEEERAYRALRGGKCSDAIDDLVFDLFEIRSAREEVRRFYQTVGRVEPVDDQAASE